MFNATVSNQSVVIVLFCFILRQWYCIRANRPCRSLKYQTGRFVRHLEGQILSGHVISSLSFTSILSCSHACVKNTNCMSFNYQHESLDSQHICQLNNCILSAAPQSHIEIRPGYSYYEESNKENECSSCYGIYGEDRCKYKAAVVKGRAIYYRSCKDWFDHGFTKSGIFGIDPDGLGPFNTYCDHVTDGGGWTVFQRRQDGSENFNRSWAEYRNGFGNPEKEFWLGNVKLHRITRSVKQLRVDIEDFHTRRAYATYGRFSIANESQGFRLFVAEYSGTAGDSLISNSDTKYIHNRMNFTTRDKDNDASKITNCGKTWSGGWWFNACFYSFLNGVYRPQGKRFGINWCSWKNSCQTLKFSEMKIR